MKHTKRNKTVLTALAVLSLLVLATAPARTAGAGDASDLARSLAKIRQEVESLSSDVEAKRDDLKNQLRSLAAQKQELELEREREEMRLRQLRAAKAKRIEQVVDDTHRDALLEPVVMRSADIVEGDIRAGIPFKTEERAEEIEKIRRKRSEGLLKSADAVARLWDRVEDELRLAGENGIYRQVVTVNGEEMLVDVARIGMVMIFYKTKDGQVGKAVNKGGRWTWTPLTAPDDRKRVLALFDSFKKQIRTGFFVLPEALPPKEDAR
jgi:hypothetical protein